MTLQGSLPYLWFLVVFVIFLIVWVQVRKIPKYSFLFVLGVLLFVGTIMVLVPAPSLNVEFQRALGHAFIIGAILAGTVDHYLKERVLREVTSDVAKYLIGYRLPEEVQGRIGELMHMKWIRRRFDLRVAFTEVVGHDDKIRADFRINEEIQNITSETLPYRDTLKFDLHEPATVMELQCNSEDANCCYYLDAEALFRIRTEHNGSVIFTAQEVRIPPVADSIGHSYRFGARYELIQPTKFSELISFNIPTIGVTIEITDHPANYRFHISPAPDYTGHNRWQFKRLFLPGEHIKIVWERNPT
jgi:hypothetical protein